MAGHKQNCNGMREECEAAGKQVVELMNKKEVPCYIRVQEHALKRLDGAGPYKQALHHGLNSAIQGLMEDDIENVHSRWEEGIAFSYVNWINCVLFRDGRQEGKSLHDRGAFSHIDSYRVKKYVLSSDDALEKWWEASLAVISVFLDKRICSDEGTFYAAHQGARDVASSWSLIFTSSTASKAIILGKSKQADEAAVERVKWMLKKLKTLLHKFWKTSVGNIGEAIEAHFNQVAGMIRHRIKEHGVVVGDVIKLLGLKGSHKAMFVNVAIPFAENTINKGRTLTNAETQAILSSQGGLR
jgi:hypothetical protein